MATILREADRTTVTDTAKKHRVSDATIYAWRKHFGRMEAADVKQLKALVPSMQEAAMTEHRPGDGKKVVNRGGRPAALMPQHLLLRRS